MILDFLGVELVCGILLIFLCTLIVIIYVNIYRERESKCKMTEDELFSILFSFFVLFTLTFIGRVNVK